MNIYRNPVQIVYGNGAISELPSLLKNIISPMGKLLLITWNEATAQLEAFTKLSEKYTVSTVCFNESNPTVEQLFDLYTKTADFFPEAVIAVGGGSVMDMGKSLCCFYGKEVSSADEMREIIAAKSYGTPKTKWIGIPTTSGTGSEVTCWATVWDPTKNAKRSVESQENFAHAAVIDPDLTKGMPVRLAVSSALDAVAHAVESYWANGSNIISKVLALGAIKTIMNNIDSLINGDEKAHEQIANGSVTAGLAFSATRTTACHSISYPLTMKHNIPHGSAVSMLLAPVAELNSSVVEDYDALLQALGVSSATELGKRISVILERAGIPSTLKKWGIRRSELPQLAALGITKGRADNNPVNLTEDMVLSVLERIY